MYRSASLNIQITIISITLIENIGVRLSGILNKNYLQQINVQNRDKVLYLRKEFASLITRFIFIEEISFVTEFLMNTLLVNISPNE